MAATGAAETERMVNILIADMKEALEGGIHSKKDALYFLAQFRKFLEKTGDDKTYLRFHCDWPFHTRLDRKDARPILKELEKVHKNLVAGRKYHQFSDDASKVVERVISLDHFRTEMFAVLDRSGISETLYLHPSFWPNFILRYLECIKDSPLLFQSSDADCSIKSAEITLETSSEAMFGQIVYRYVWTITGKDNLENSFFVFNGFDDPEAKAPISSAV